MAVARASVAMPLPMPSSTSPIRTAAVESNATTTAMPERDQGEDARGRLARGRRRRAARTGGGRGSARRRSVRPRRRRRPAEWPRSSRNGIANTVIAIVAQRRQHERARQQPERRASAAPSRPRPSVAGCAASARRAGRRTSACSGTVIDGEDRRRGRAARRASRSASISACESGRKMKLASAATSVIAVIARRRSPASVKCLARR